MSSPIKYIDLARLALASTGNVFQMALNCSFWWKETSQGNDFWNAQHDAGRLSDSGRTALEAMIAEYEAEHGGEVAEAAQPVPAKYVVETDIDKNGQTYHDVFEGSEHLARCSHQIVANRIARALSTAPEMLAALKEAQEWLYRAVPRASLETEDRARLQRIDAAIKRAEGRS